MRVTPTDLTALSSAIAPFDTRETRDRYAARDIPRGDLVKDIDKRYRWDLFWAAGGMETIAGCYADAHIDTALRRVVPSLVSTDA